MINEDMPFKIPEMSIQIVQPMCLFDDFESIEKKVHSIIKEYSIDVTEQNISEAKKIATYLNKLSNEGYERVIATIKEAEEPIIKARQNTKRIYQIIQDARASIVNQVKGFEEKRLNLLREMLNTQVAKQYKENCIEESFQNASIEHLVKLVNISEKNLISRKCIEDISAQIQKCLNLQNKVKCRLLELENISLKEGLEVPLDASYVNDFIKEEDSVYIAKLNDVLAKEIKRQAKIEKNILEKTNLKKEVANINLSTVSNGTYNGEIYRYSATITINIKSDKQKDVLFDKIKAQLDTIGFSSAKIDIKALNDCN